MAIIIFIIGLFIGSTIYAFVLRFHNHKNWLTGRSECDFCHHVLAPIDLIPVISWVSVKGRCRYCHARLSWHYPTVEIVTASLFTLSYVFYSKPVHGIGLFQFICWLILLVGFMILTIYDLIWLTLPDKIVFSLAVFALFDLVVVSLVKHSLSLLIGGLIGAIIVSGIFYVLFQASRGKWIGGGDVKLGLGLGLIVGGPVHAVLLIFIASLVGSLVAVPLSIYKKTMRVRIPFGPFLMFAASIVFFFGTDIVTWYGHLIG